MKTNIETLDKFTLGYLECALWSSTNDNGENNPPPLDETHGIYDIAPETLAQMKADCDQFTEANYDALCDAENYYDFAHAGHDFWLTRNGHGAGFWDGDLPEELGDRLTKAAKQFPECNLYVGDDGKIYT